MSRLIRMSSRVGSVVACGVLTLLMTTGCNSSSSAASGASSQSRPSATATAVPATTDEFVRMSATGSAKGAVGTAGTAKEGCTKDGRAFLVADQGQVEGKGLLMEGCPSALAAPVEAELYGALQSVGIGLDQTKMGLPKDIFCTQGS